MKVTGSQLSKQRVTVLGAGSSAIGISDQIVAGMMREGLSEADARSALWLVDSRGLVHSARTNLESAKQRYAQPVELLKDWKLERPDRFTLMDVVANARPSIVIGTSAQPGGFSEEVVRAMAENAERLVVLPLSNPTSKSEAAPADILRWTDGRALVATGSPFAPVTYNGQTFNIGQCNNAFIFPGVGLGVLAARATRVTKEMFVAAALTLSDLSPALSDPSASLYPPLERVREASRKVAVAVAREGQRSGLAEQTSIDELEGHINEKIWTPNYRRLIPESV